MPKKASSSSSPSKSKPAALNPDGSRKAVRHQKAAKHPQYEMRNSTAMYILRRANYLRISKPLKKCVIEDVHSQLDRIASLAAAYVKAHHTKTITTSAVIAALRLLGYKRAIGVNPIRTTRLRLKAKKSKKAGEEGGEKAKEVKPKRQKREKKAPKAKPVVAEPAEAAAAADAEPEAEPAADAAEDVPIE